MSSITQTIDSYIGGISQQPDQKKLPGQVTEAVNVLPDVTLGLQKRPGAELVASLSDGTLNSTTNGRWFHYYRDENEQYIGQVLRTSDSDNGKIRMWKCSDGSEKNVTFESGQESDITAYLQHIVDEDIQTLTLNDYTYITNRTKATAMLPATSPPKVYETYVELKKVAYSRQYSLNMFDDNTKQDVTTATRISVGLVASSNNYCDGNGYMVARGAREAMATKCDDSAGLNRDSLAPNTATGIFSVGTGQTLTDEGVGGTGASGAIDADHEYTLVVYNKNNNITSGCTYTRSSGTITVTHPSNHGYSTNDYVDLNFGGSATDGQYQLTKTADNTYTVTDYVLTSGTETSTAVSVSPGITTAGAKKDLYFQITNISQAIPQGAGSSVEYFARYTTTHDLLYGGKGWELGDYCYIWMKDGLYLVEIEEISTAKVQANLGLIRPQPTPFDTETTTTSEQVLGAIQTAILNSTQSDGNPSPWKVTSTPSTSNTYTSVSIIGNGLYINHTSPFNVSALDDELLNVVSDEIQNIEDLPSQCKHGYVVKISNTEANEDDYYLRFEGHNGRDGKGAW